MEFLCKNRKNRDVFPGCNIRRISWFVAHRFNKGHGDRVWDAKQAKLKLLEKHREKTRDCFDEKGNFKDDESRRKAIESHQAALICFKLIDSGHRQSQLLTAKHRASFSRSLKRLERRGLIKCYVDLRLEKRNGKLFWVWYVGDGRTRYVDLTEKGLEVCGKMLTFSGKSA